MNIHDVAILGAGPCGLAVAARLREASPSALFTDTEHARFWNRRHDRNTLEREYERHHQPRKPASTHCSSSRFSSRRPSPSLVVFDATSDQWLSSWRAKFDRLKIEHLRSPLFFHPDPSDRDGLLAFAHESGREESLAEIEGVVGKEVSKHRTKRIRACVGKEKKSRKGECQASARHLHLDNRDQNDYYTPSSSLFDAYIDDIIQRYDVKNVVQQSSIVDIVYGLEPISNTMLFTLTTSTGEKHLSRTVVLATGPNSPPTIPSSLRPLLEICHLAIGDGSRSQCSISHVFDSLQQHPKHGSTPTPLPQHVLDRLTSPVSPSLHSSHKITPTIVIVGGGLTSAQIADLLLTTYPTLRVHLLLRSKLKIKHFDIDLPWVAKLRNRSMAEFWSADTDEERWRILVGAKGGGSITPGYAKRLKKWMDCNDNDADNREVKGSANGQQRRKSTERGNKGVCHQRLWIHEDVEIDTTKTTWDDRGRVWGIRLKPSSSSSSSFSTSSSSQSLPPIPPTSHILLATTSPPSITSLPCLQTLLQTHPIPIVHDLPVLTTQELSWREDVPLFVTGALAGLKLGPGAGNLMGARAGAERVTWGVERWLDGGGDRVGIRKKVEGRKTGKWERQGESERKRKRNRKDSGYVSADVSDNGGEKEEGVLVARVGEGMEKEEEDGENEDEEEEEEEEEEKEEEEDLLRDYQRGIGNRFAGLSVA